MKFWIIKGKDTGTHYLSLLNTNTCLYIDGRLHNSIGGDFNEL